MAILSHTLQSSLTFKVFFIAFLILLLLIPMEMVENIIRERSHQYRQANAEITKVWGDNHVFTGPVLTVPRFRSETHQSGWSQSVLYQHVAPEEMTVSAVFETQLRYRGIYKVPVYLANISCKGKFEVSDLTKLEVGDKALIQIPFMHSKSLKIIPVLHWNGQPVALSPLADGSTKDAVIFQASIPLTEIGNGEFELVYASAGSAEFNLNSWAKKTILTIKSDWGSPSFQGEFFPTTYAIQSAGFSATWNINNIILNAMDSEEELISNDQFQKRDLFGVKFIQLADTYQLVTRSAKYAVLFISLTFLVYFLVEVLGAYRLHSIQYLLIGLSNCIFYLLLLSLSEHINFNLAYCLSACSSTLLISLYSKSIFQNTFRAALVFLVLVALYVYLFITLQSEGFALVTGSIGLFVIMALLMYLTRNTNWHALSLPDQQ